MLKSARNRETERDILHARIRRCRKCVLWKARRNAVPGEGPIDARLMLMGEAPGRKEDETGRPFVGPAGKYLDQVLDAAGIDRGKVFITSVVKCLPSGGGKPSKASIDACNPYLQQQIKLVDPHIVCLLGQVSAKTVLGIDKVGSHRGSLIERDGRLFLVTYHPSAARRFPKLRDAILTDLRLLAGKAV